MIKTFRGLLVDSGKQEINLHTNDGKTGYRIVKFIIVTDTPTVTSEHLVQIWSEESAADATLNSIDFSNQRLLGAALWSNDSSAQTNPDDFHVIFDRQIINQDIFVTNQNLNGSSKVNYYIELEQIALDLNEATVATLQSIRS